MQESGRGGLSDQPLLDWAASERRIFVTHDVNTITRHAYERLKQGLPMPGVIIVPDYLEIGQALSDLEIIIECATELDLQNQIQYLPL